MRLNLIYEAGYWQPIANHPGQLGKRDKRAKKNDMSFLVHPGDRKRWLKWFSGGKKIKEDLDDVDEFGEFELRELTTPDEISQVLSAGTRNYFPPPFLQRMLKEGPVYSISKMGEPYALLADHLRNTEGMASKKISGPLARFLLQKIETGEIRGQAIKYIRQLIEYSKKRATPPQPTMAHESSRQRRLVEDLDDVDEFTNMPSQEQLEQAITQLRASATGSGMPGRSHVLNAMERMYERMVGRPYNPTNTAPRM